MQLRDYQQFAVDKMFEWLFNSVGNGIVVQPTGTGKSLDIAGFVAECLSRYSATRVMCLAHVKELIEQNTKTLVRYWGNAPVGICSTGLRRHDIHNQIIFGGMKTVLTRLDQFLPPDILIIDECHLVSPKEDTGYQKIIKYFTERNPQLRVIGFTATDYRLGQGKLTDDGIFGSVIVDMAGVEWFNWFVDQGYLCRLVPKPTRLKLNTNGVKESGGDYVQASLEKAINKAEITTAAVKEMIEMGKDRQAWLVFTTGVDHCEQVVKELEWHGVSARPIHNKVPAHLQEQYKMQHKAGQVRALVNMNRLTTGYDDPRIDFMPILRPTLSPGLWVQILGRGTRPLYMPGFDLSTQEGRWQAQLAGPKHNCLVADFASNTANLGPINDPVIPRRKGKGGGTPPVKFCEDDKVTAEYKALGGLTCGSYNHASARYCIDCGAPFHFKVKFSREAATDNLVRSNEEKKAENEPVYEVFPVNNVFYDLHTKNERTSLMVTYTCGRKNYKSFFNFESDKAYPKIKAAEWWQKAHGGTWTQVPKTNEEAYLRICSRELLDVRSVTVWTNKTPYPEVTAYEFATQPTR